MLSIIFPTLNEEDNVQPLFEEIRLALKGVIYEIVMIDANSKDRTVEVAEDLKKKGHPVTIYLSPVKKDLAGDTYYGFQFAKYDLIGVMDSDFQHDPKFFPDLLDVIQNDPEVDMVIGSRYATGGGLGNWALHRKIISKVAVSFTKLLSGVSDPLTQFYIIKKKVLEVPNIKAEGMRLSLQLITKGNINKIVEVPIIFRARGGGETTQSLKRILIDLRAIAFIGLARLQKSFSNVFSRSKPNGTGL